MTTQDQTSHFPCGPCPIVKEISSSIQHYTTLLQNLKLFLGVRSSPIELEYGWKQISLVQGFLDELYVYQSLIQAAIDANRPEEVE